MWPVSLCEVNHLLLIRFLLHLDIELISIFRRKFMVVAFWQYAVVAGFMLLVAIASSAVE